MRKLIQLTSCLIFLAAFYARAQDAAPPPADELNLEEELNQSLGNEQSADPAAGDPTLEDSTNPGVTETPAPTEETSPDAALEDEMSLSEDPAAVPAEDPALAAPAADMELPGAAPMTEADGDGESEQVREIEPTYALNGFSVGVQIWQHRYDIKASMTTRSGSGTREVNLSSSSADFQSAGVVGRYAVLPYNALGTDLSMTLGTMVNNGGGGFSSIHTVRAEGNLGWAFELGQDVSFYVLGGLGYEFLFGEDIEKIVAAGGAGTAQVGAGLGMGKQFNIEVFYAQAFHHINDGFIQNAGQDAINKGATSYTYDSQAASVKAEMIYGRVMVNF